MTIRDRIKEFRRVPSAELIANPKNWREHPPEQKKALQGVLDEVGIAGALLARETPEGLELIDGHLRSDVDAKADWPVLILDVDEREADILLASVDPIAALAKTNQVGLQQLLETLETENEDLQSLIDELSNNTLVHEPLEQEDGTEIPMDLEYIVVANCENEKQQIEIIKWLEKGGYPCKAQIV